MTARDDPLGARVRLRAPWVDPSLPRPCGVLEKGPDGRMRVRWDGGEPPEEAASAKLFVLDVLCTRPPRAADGP